MANFGEFPGREVPVLAYPSLPEPKTAVSGRLGLFGDVRKCLPGRPGTSSGSCPGCLPGRVRDAIRERPGRGFGSVLGASREHARKPVPGHARKCLTWPSRGWQELTSFGVCPKLAKLGVCPEGHVWGIPWKGVSGRQTWGVGNRVPDTFPEHVWRVGVCRLARLGCCPEGCCARATHYPSNHIQTS